MSILKNDRKIVMGIKKMLRHLDSKCNRTPFFRKNVSKLVSAVMLTATIVSAQPQVQTSSVPTFDIASVKLNKTNAPASSVFPLGPGDVYVPNGGRFFATGLPLVTYISFAYKIIGNQGQFLLPQLPEWAKTDHYDIEARTSGNPGKDEMRLMMRALLAERFGLKLHAENREVPILGFVLEKPGQMGPKLWRHADTSDCPTDANPATQGPAPTDPRGLPTLCNGIFGLPPSEPGRTKLGARSITLQFLADSLSSGLGRPVVDQTGLSGRVDFLLEFVPDRVTSSRQGGTDALPELAEPTLQQALREQLGIKLQRAKNKLEVLVLDHIERPSEN